MRDVWQLRSARQMVLGLIPLLAICTTLLIIFGILGVQTAGKLSDATAQTTGTVQQIDSTGNPRPATIDWTDKTGQQHTSHIDFPAGGHPDKGATVHLRYVPTDPNRVYAQGDSTFDRANNLSAGVLYVAVVLFAVLVFTAIRIWRRVALARQPGKTVKLSRVRTHYGLIHRSWLVSTRGNRERWVPVYWDRVLSEMPSDTPCTVHGDLDGTGIVVVRVGETVLWPSGRVRDRAPRGQQISNPGTYSAKTPLPDGKTVRLARQAAGDCALVVLAPILGILWAYINGFTAAGFGVATALLAGILFWVPTSFGSDPA